MRGTRCANRGEIAGTISRGSPFSRQGTRSIGTKASAVPATKLSISRGNARYGCIVPFSSSATTRMRSPSRSTRTLRSFITTVAQATRIPAVRWDSDREKSLGDYRILFSHLFRTLMLLRNARTRSANVPGATIASKSRRSYRNCKPSSNRIRYVPNGSSGSIASTTPERPARGVRQLRRMRTWFPLLRSIPIPSLSSMFIATPGRAANQRPCGLFFCLHNCGVHESMPLECTFCTNATESARVSLFGSWNSFTHAGVNPFGCFSNVLDSPGTSSSPAVH